MKSKARFRLVAIGIVVLALLALGLSAGPFGRGIVVGAAGVVSLLAGGVFVLSRTAAKRLHGRLEAPPLPTGVWDHDMQVEDLDGTPVDFAVFRGRVLVLNFWATWCGPCVAEMPGLQRLHEQISGFGGAVACVTREKGERVRKFIEKRGLEVPVFVLSGEPPECFRSRAIPATFVLDRNGMIALRHFGSAKWDAEQVVAFVRGLAVAPQA